MLSTNRKGAIAETAIAAAATKLGIPVLRPITEHGRYDLAFEIGDRILRVQCKWGGLYENGAVIKVNLTSSWCTPTGYSYRPYEEDEIDLLAVYSADLHTMAAVLVACRGVFLRGRLERERPSPERHGVPGRAQPEQRRLGPRLGR